MSEVDLRQAVDDLRSLIDLVDAALPEDGEVQLPMRPAPLRAIEDLYMVRRSVGSVHRLMEGTVAGDDEDRTEDAALLVRRIVEFLADAYWMTEDGTDPDHQALRAMLSDLDEQARKCKKAIAMNRSEDAVRGASEALDRIEGEVAEISKTLAEAGAKTKRRPTVSQILDAHDESLSFYWSFEADVAHGGVVGRGLQRNEKVDVGADAEPWRRALVVQLAFSAAGEIFDRCMWLIGLPESLREAFKNGWSELPSAAVVLAELRMDG